MCGTINHTLKSLDRIKASTAANHQSFAFFASSWKIYFHQVSYIILNCTFLLFSQTWNTSKKEFCRPSNQFAAYFSSNFFCSELETLDYLVIFFSSLFEAFLLDGRQQKRRRNIWSTFCTLKDKRKSQQTQSDAWTTSLVTLLFFFAVALPDCWSQLFWLWR